jgi:hypothetical protein
VQKKGTHGPLNTDVYAQLLKQGCEGQSNNSVDDSSTLAEEYSTVELVFSIALAHSNTSGHADWDGHAVFRASWDAVWV